MNPIALVLVFALSASGLNALPTNVMVETFAGSQFTGTVDGVGTRSMFDMPGSIAIGENGTIYCGQIYGSLRVITPDATVATVKYFSGSAIQQVLLGPGDAPFVVLAVDGLFSVVTNGQPEHISYDAKQTIWHPTERVFFIAVDNVIKKVPLQAYSEGQVFVGSAKDSFQIDGTGIFCSFGYLRSIALNVAGELLVIDSRALRRITMAGDVTTIAPEGSLPENATNLVPLPDGGVLFAVDSKILLRTSDGAVTVLAGGASGYRDGPAEVALFNTIGGIAVAANGDLFVADTGNNRIRRLRMPQGEHAVPPSEISIEPFVGVTIKGIPGRSYRIESSTDASPSNWQPRATLQLTTTPFRWLDETPASDGRRFYRVISIE